MKNPNCHKCIHSKKIPGDVHLECAHPKIVDNPLKSMIALCGVGSSMGQELTTELNIKANSHGIKNGWFLWPINFDCAWLENCDGYEEKENA